MNQVDYPRFHVLKFVFEIGEAESGRRKELFDGRDEAIARNGRHLTLRSVIFQLFLNSFQTAAQLIHFLLQFHQTVTPTTKFMVMTIDS